MYIATSIKKFNTLGESLSVDKNSSCIVDLKDLDTNDTRLITYYPSFKNKVLDIFEDERVLGLSDGILTRITDLEFDLAKHIDFIGFEDINASLNISGFLESEYKGIYALSEDSIYAYDMDSQNTTIMHLILTWCSDSSFKDLIQIGENDLHIFIPKSQGDNAFICYSYRILNFNKFKNVIATYVKQKLMSKAAK